MRYKLCAGVSLAAFLAGSLSVSSPALAACGTGGVISANSTNCQTLSGGGSLAVDSGVSLAVSSSNDTVTVNSQSSGVTIDNAGTISNSTNGKRAITINGSTQTDLVITNKIGATITATGDDAIHGGKGSKPITAGSITIDNYGLISATGTDGANGQALDFASTSSSIAITINNHGTLSSADSDGIRPGENAVVNNYGTIAGNATVNDGSDGIDFQSNANGTVNNYAGGSVSGARHGITGDNAFTLYNEGVITGQLGSGINLDTVAGTAVITNAATGVITGNAAGDNDGDGIDVDYLVTINNYGQINGHGTWTGGLSEAITIGGGEINNYAGGTIHSVERAITVDDSNLGGAFAATSIYNEGTIQGDNGEAIAITDSLADTITNKGSIIGSVATGGGDDVFNLHAGSSITGNVDGGADSDTVNLMGTGSGSLGGVNNVEQLNIVSGDWTVSGTQNYAGSVAVGSGGSLALNGALSTSGASFADNSQYAVTIGASGVSNILAVSGTLTAGGGSEVAVTAGAPSYTIGADYTIATYSTLSGAFGSVTDTSALYDFAIDYGNGEVTLRVTRDASIGLTSLAGTSNQAGVASGLSSLGSGNAVVSALASTPDAEMGSALNQLSGDSHANLTASLTAGGHFVRDISFARLNQAFGGGNGVANGGLGGGGQPSLIGRKADADLRKAARSDASAAAIATPALWTEGFGSFSRAWDDNAGTQTGSTGGLMIGGDAFVPLGSGWRLGVAGSYAQSDFDAGSRNASEDVDTFSGIAYAGTRYGNMDIRLGLSASHHNIYSHRLVDFGSYSESLNANYTASTLQGFGEIGYVMRAGSFTAVPFAGLSHLVTHTDSFTETGGAAALSADDASNALTFTNLGVRLEKNYDQFSARASLAWQHSFGDLAPTSSLAFAAGGDSFNVSGAASARDAALIGAGVNFQMSDALSLSLDYQGTLAERNWEQGAHATLRLRY